MQTVEGREVTPKVLGVLDSGESLVFAAMPDYATPPSGQHWDSTFLLLTDRRLLVTKRKALGRSKADFEVPWSQVSTIEGGLWNGGGPKIQLIVSTRLGNLELIVIPNYAVDVESAIRHQYLAARS